MTKESMDKAADEWLAANHPAYVGWRMRSLAHEYDLACLPQEFATHVNKCVQDEYQDNFCDDDFAGLIERVIPPEGYVYLTFEREGVRVGVNMPIAIWQTKEPS